MDKIKLIQKIMPENGEILVRTHGKDQWFVHYYSFTHEENTESIHKVYTKDLDGELDKIMKIIRSKA